MWEAAVSELWEDVGRPSNLDRVSPCRLAVCHVCVGRDQFREVMGFSSLALKPSSDILSCWSEPGPRIAATARLFAVDGLRAQ